MSRSRYRSASIRRRLGRDLVPDHASGRRLARLGRLRDPVVRDAELRGDAHRRAALEPGAVELALEGAYLARQHRHVVDGGDLRVDRRLDLLRLLVLLVLVLRHTRSRRRLGWAAAPPFSHVVVSDGTSVKRNQYPTGRPTAVPDRWPIGAWHLLATPLREGPRSWTPSAP